MNTQRIHRLLQRYEAAQTTLAEENELREFFAQGEVPAELQRYASLFTVPRVLAKAPTPSFPAGPWDQAVQASTSHQDSPLASASAKTKPSPLHVVHRRRIAIAAVAAVALLLVLMWLPEAQKPSAPQPIAELQPTESPAAIDWSKYEVTDPEEATRITREALATVASSMQTGGAFTQRELGRMKPIHKIL